ncbi:RluA family pseudouridine synthase [Flavicella marina]|uniref:RluA family pseudouridine synthase n=1 Tax=Flavicella marina TaxID=1475951 RepID=UPI0012641ED0|nr:RluA family pseudouridine synthase [Flavicella marina]
MNSNSPKLLKIESYIVPTLLKKTRLQDLAADMFTMLPTKSGVKKALKNKLVKIDNQIVNSSTFLYGGETIDLYQNQKNNQKPTIQIALKIIYEDEHLALINKPAGITVSGTKKYTLENALSGNLAKSKEPDALIRPEPIHRLDHPTSGILLIGKTSKSVVALNKLFENRTIRKTYYAITIGKMQPFGSIETAIETKNARTSYEVIYSEKSDRFDFLNLVKLSPHSGRKHQLRIHLSEQETPILGDKTYGSEGKILNGNGLYLHAYSLEFTHPITGDTINYKAKPPKKFTRLFPEITY